ncbi:MAG: GMC family oxidoreductase [Leptospiraceae bacterium]|nr:GMC family oxidoreductase [Leptospiraceae bacterium]MDW8306986.1 GMC family oxidoreductase [Leptospiraceae bacterium]
MDFDYVVVGSGFGGSVSAMRLAQKGYRVAVFEMGRRFRPQDFPKTNWDVRRFFWAPKLFCYGMQRLSLLRDTLVLSGAGVGGGSLIYANTLYVPPDAFFEHPEVKKLGGKKELLPYYELAKKMLGVVENPHLGEVDRYMYEIAEEMGRGHTFVPTPVGIYFGAEGKESDDPYFYGEGPRRSGCNQCGGCMVGCRFDAKNTLDKNYLYFAEKFGAQIFPETQVVDVEPLGAGGRDGYKVYTRKSTSFWGFPRRCFHTKGIVFAAGVLGTLGLLFRLKDKGRLPLLSPCLGERVRTNSESIVGVRSRQSDVDFSKGIAITSSVHPDNVTHIEPVRYPAGSDAMGFLSTILVDEGGFLPRQLRFIGTILKKPMDFLRVLNIWGFARRTIILLIMQTVDNSLKLSYRRTWLWPFTKKLTSQPSEGKPIPKYIPIGNEFARRLARKIQGIPLSSINEVLLNIPMTAHILGGCPISDSPETGVLDKKNQVFGYSHMLVCDGSMIPANLGVNPSLSIVAFTERAMSFIPVKPGEKMKWLKAEKKWKVESLLLPKTSSISKYQISKKKKKLS